MPCFGQRHSELNKQKTICQSCSCQTCEDVGAGRWLLLSLLFEINFNRSVILYVLLGLKMNTYTFVGYRYQQDSYSYLLGLVQTAPLLYSSTNEIDRSRVVLLCFFPEGNFI